MRARAAYRSRWIGVAVAICLSAPHGAARADDAATPVPRWDEVQQARAKGDTARVIALTGMLLDADPDNTDALVVQGFAYLAIGDLVSAERNFEETVRLAPDYLDASLGLAYVALRRGKTEEAARLAQAVVAVDPTYVEARDVIARAHQMNAPEPDAPDIGSPVVVSDLPVAQAASKAHLRTFSGEFGAAWGERTERDMVLAFADRFGDGSTMVYRLRQTGRAAGDAVQIGLQRVVRLGERSWAGELALGAGADNLARFRIGGSVAATVSKGISVEAALRAEVFSDARILTAIPKIDYIPGDGGVTASLRIPVSFTSEAGSAAAVLDARIRLPIDDGLELGIGYAAGEEFDGVEKRRIEAASVSLFTSIGDDTQLVTTLSHGPYANLNQTRLGVSVARSF